MTNTIQNINNLAAILDIRPKNFSYYETALTHISASKIAGGSSPYNNERLEFFGDRVLAFVLTEELFHKYADKDEGKLAKKLSWLASRELMEEIAIDLNLADYIIVGKNDENVRNSRSILAGAVEAIFAAIYLDLGMDEAKKVALHLWRKYLDLKATPLDTKSALQEYAHSAMMGTPNYELVNRDGPDHNPVFTISVSLSNGLSAQAKAGSKKEAERLAAKYLIQKIEEKK